MYLFSTIVHLIPDSRGWPGAPGRRRTLIPHSQRSDRDLSLSGICVRSRLFLPVWRAEAAVQGATETLTSAHGFSSTSFFFSAHSQQAFIIKIRSRTVTGLRERSDNSQSRKFSATVSETEIVVLFLKNTETCFWNAVYLANVPFSLLRRLYSTKRSNSSETEIDSCFWGLYFASDGSKLSLVMSSSIWRAWMEAAKAIDDRIRQTDVWQPLSSVMV